MTLRPSRWLCVFAAALVALVAAPGGAHARKHKKKRLLVSFKEGTSRAERERAAKDLGLILSEDLDDLEAALLEAAGEVSPQEAARARKDPRILDVQEDVYKNWLLDASIPSVEQVWETVGGKPKAKPAAPKADAGEETWGIRRVGAPDAWPRGEGRGIKVAVIDTGVDCSHPDLQCDASKGTNVVEPGAPPMDDNEHGTHVAGTIAARRDGKGVVGVAPLATIIPVKVLDKDGAGSLSDIVKGINWAASAGVDVINMSLGGAQGSKALERAVAKALNKGVVIIAAAGNSGPNPDTTGFPAGYPGVIAIAASDVNDKVAKFSSRGDAVAFIAPGVDVKSTIPGGGYASFSGTSMACPHMAGLAALAIERGASGPAGVRAAFARAATKLCSASICAGPTEQGQGLVDAAKLGGGRLARAGK